LELLAGLLAKHSFLFFRVIFSLLDPDLYADPDPDLTAQINADPDWDTDPDLKPCFRTLERLDGLLAEHSSLLQVGLIMRHFGALELLSSLLGEHSRLLQVGLIMHHIRALERLSGLLAEHSSQGYFFPPGSGFVCGSGSGSNSSN
jgi:hypothetical protein